MANYNDYQLDEEWAEFLNKNSAMSGDSSCDMVGQLLDDKFGGAVVGKDVQLDALDEQMEWFEKLFKH